MKQVFTSKSQLVCNSQTSYLNANAKKFPQVLVFVFLSVFTITNSSCKKEVCEDRVKNTKQMKKAVPFKGSLLVSLGEGGTSGTGVGSHVGSFQYVSVDDFSNFPYVTGNATITAANGDKIFTTFSGYLTPADEDVFSISFENTITGGTGRFEGATGSYTSTGTANTTSSTANTTFSGTISY